MQMAVKLDVRWRVPNVGGKPYAAQLPGDSADGSFLHDANCLRCHDTGIYTRKDGRIRSLDTLKGQLIGQLQSYG